MEEKIIRKNFNIKRGMIALCNLGEGIGSEQLGKRPCVIVQNDTGNKFSPTVVVAPLTSKNWKTKLPTQAEINIIDSGAIEKNSLALCEQLRTIDKTRVEKIYGSVSEKDMVNINDIEECYKNLFSDKWEELIEDYIDNEWEGYSRDNLVDKICYGRDELIEYGEQE